MRSDQPQPGDRPREDDSPRYGSRDYWQMVADRDAASEAKQGYNETSFRGWIDKSKDNLEVERRLWFRYDDANNKGIQREAAGDSMHDPREHPPDDRAVRLRREVHEAARENLPDVGDRRDADRQHSTTADIFDENGTFLRREISGGKNPDNTKDARVDEAIRLAEERLGWRPIAESAKHTETKTAVDVVNDNLPKRIAMIINNTECNGPRSCRAFMSELLSDGREITVYDYYGHARVYPELPEQGR